MDVVEFSIILLFVLYLILLSILFFFFFSCLLLNQMSNLNFYFISIMTYCSTSLSLFKWKSGVIPYASVRYLYLYLQREIQIYKTYYSLPSNIIPLHVQQKTLTTVYIYFPFPNFYDICVIYFTFIDLLNPTINCYFA